MKKRALLHTLITLIVYSCATTKPSYRTQTFTPVALPKKEIAHTFYLVGDAGKSVNNLEANGLKAFKAYIEDKNTSNATTVYLGDNVYPFGLPDKSSEKRAQAEIDLNLQINAVTNFDGRTVFIPGNHDWYAKGIKGLKNQEKYIEDALGKNTFLPENGCPLESVEISKTVELIVIDSEWYLEDWNTHPTINDECDIKTRERFFLEVEGALKKAQNKTIIFAMHHPMYTNGTHGGFYGASKHLYPFQKKIPLPGFASLITQIRSQGGVSIQDRYNERYNELMNRLETLLVDYKNLIVVSGHEHSLQYIEDEYVKQIVSGAASKHSDAALNNNGLFSYGKEGFAEFTIYKDGSAWAQFFGYENNKPTLLYQKEVFPPRKTFTPAKYTNTFPKTIEASIYTEEETEKTEFFKSLWGKHYRALYSTKIKARVATLDTLYGGLEVVRKGGGHQTRSLRLKTKDGKQLNMRALRKSATQYLQTVLFKDKYIQDDFERTKVEDLILDFYTSSHPYAFLAVPELSKAIDVLHTNPKLYYIPKHDHLGKYNEEYGDELYLIEERPEDSYTEERTFGYADDIESTHDIIEKIRKDEKYKIDEAAFIRARLFDMLLGDWDRHQDQWRWAQFDQPNGDKLYRPIPRDRDQVFSNFDGGLLNIVRFISSPSKQLQVYDDDLDDGDIQWMNTAGVKLDRILLQQANKEDWVKQAKFIQQNLNEAIIEQAFSNLPQAAKDEKLEAIKRHFSNRKNNLDQIAKRYYNFLTKLVILTGTDKDDFIDVTRKPDATTQIVIHRNKNGKRAEVLVDRTFSREQTKEIWIYGLDDKDHFTVTGKAKKPIKIRIIGGQEKDSYQIDSGKRIKIYDHKTKPNTILAKNGADVNFTNYYNNNIFDYKKYNYSTGIFSPLLGFNPDDGILTGFAITKTKYGFERNPFTAQHKIRFGYYFATEGFDVNYKGEFNVKNRWNLRVESLYTSNNFARNFFGFGNDTDNNDDDDGLDFNRVRTSIFNLKVGLLRKGIFGSDFGFRAILEGIRIEDTPNRFITNLVPVTNTDFYERRYFAGLESIFNYESVDDAINPTRGMKFHVDLGAKTDLDASDSTFGYLNSSIGFYNSISKNRKLVLKTNASTQLRVGNDIIFYQAASIGGRTGLRGFRLQRFTGQNALVGNADLRYSFNSFKTKTIPLQFGVFGGYDVGRVWVNNTSSNTWHQSYGGGFWVSSAASAAGVFNLFNSVDGLRFSFNFKFKL